MVEVTPLRGWRYDVGQVGSLADVTAPPYDVINAAGQKELYEKHPCNCIRLILNRDEPGDESSDARYERASRFLSQWKQDGILQQEKENAFYVYNQEFDWEGTHYVRTGFLGRIKIEEFGKGEVYPHEQTMSGPKADRLALLKAGQTNLSPIFGLYPDTNNNVQDPLDEAVRGITPLEVTDELGVLHRIWAVTDHAVISKVQEALREKPIFIADGHHRYETANNYRNWLQSEGKLGDNSDPANYVLMHFVGMSDPGLAILPTHRLVSGLENISAEELQTTLGDHFELEEIGTGDAAAKETWELMDADGGQDVFGFGTPSDGKWFFARLTDASPMKELAAGQSEEWQQLGVSLLHRLVIDHLIKNKHVQGEISWKYVHLMDEVNNAMTNKSCQLACLVAPAGIEHVETIASEFEKMPPKSTFFYPKLLSGLVFNPLT